MWKLRKVAFCGNLRLQFKKIVILDLFVCWKIIFFFKVNSEKINSRKVNYFPMFSSVMKNKLENIFQCLVI